MKFPLIPGKTPKDIDSSPAPTYDEVHLVNEIKLAKNAIDAAYSSFQQATDPDLIDCCIYMMNASQMRYRFLISRARKINLKCSSLDDLYEIANLPEEI